MKLATRVCIYLGVSGSGVLANFVLWRYRLHLYELNADYSREPLRTIQVILFRLTQGVIVAGFLVLAWKLVEGKKKQAPLRIPAF